MHFSLHHLSRCNEKREQNYKGTLLYIMILQRLFFFAEQEKTRLAQDNK